MIYLDNSATTKVDKRVVEAMIPYLNEVYGNPSSKYYTLATSAKKAVKKARSQVAKLLNCSPEEIIFTSGATESNNFIIKGIADFYKDQGNHIITSSIEHKSVLETCKYLSDKNYEITFIEPDKKGKINPEKIKSNIKEDTILISIMWGNNELGTLNDVNSIAKIAEENDSFFHTDATQVVGKNNVNLNDIPVDLLSCSAHKFHGPKGVGIAYIKTDDLGFRKKITPLLHGGEQEFKLRAGTLSVHNIVGMGKAAEIANNEMKKYIPKIEELEKVLKENLIEVNDNIKFNGDQKNKIPGIINVTIPGINNELFIKEHKKKIAISTGSACSITEPSHVLKAIGLTEQEIMATLRISLSKYNDKNKIINLINFILL
ncbi:MAG: cysteine desulfurase family protein [Candidatus Woesearchaeota archaeon]